MTQQRKDEPSTPAGGGPVPGESVDEFEDAVTTEISAAMARAFGSNSPGRDHDHVEVTDINLSAQPMPAEFDVLEPGVVIGERFQIVELVHSGGMSHVYKAVDLRRHRSGSAPLHVAIKTMRRRTVSQHDSRRALEHEAARAQRLSHPNIINVFDFDEHEDQFYLVMEWLDGESLNALLKRTKGQGLDSSFAWPIIESIASAVQHAHRNNIVHADINPSNVFITATHEIKLLDFGVARDCSDKSDVAGTRMAWATQTYASPEVLDGITPVFEDDVFSLGCIAYRLLSGNHPFDGQKSIKARDDGVKVAPIAGLADEDWQIIRRSLDYSRSNRPKTAAAFCRSERRFVAGEHTQYARGSRQWRWLPGIVIAVAVAAGGWLAWSNLPQSRTPVPAPGPQVIDQPPLESTAANESTVIAEPTSESDLVNEPTDVDEPAAELIPANEPTVSNETTLAPMPAVEFDSATGDLLAAAALAMTEQRFLQPEENNARYWYRQVLDIQPDNPIALRGLRQVSDTFVRRAEAAFRAGNPAEAAAALTLAADTDAGNPSIEIVNYMLVSQGDQLLADARAAALAGDPAATAVLLAKAEEYAHIDEAALRDVGDLLATALQEEELRGRIAAVDEHISNGRLLSPDGENAHTLLLELVGEFGNDERLLYTTDRLAQGLLTSASVSMATGDADAAAEYLDAVDALAFVSPEVATARSSLRTAIETAASTATAGAASEPVPASAPAESAPVRRQLISELGIDRYVAPKYPRSARRRGISGFVEVAFTLNPDGTTGDVRAVDSIPREIFDESAEDAVRQWRFKPREQAASARIVLSFQLEP